MAQTSRSSPAIGGAVPTQCDELHYYYGGMLGLHGDMLSTEEADLAAKAGRRYRKLAPLGGESLSRMSGELPDQGAMCRATWKRGRLWALTTAAGGNLEGFATTSASMRQGQTLDIGARTIGNGEVLAELVDADGNVPPGFGRETSDAFTGDESRSKVTWRGNAECPADGLRARFYLRQAFLYGFEFVDAGAS